MSHANEVFVLRTKDQIKSDIEVGEGVSVNNAVFIIMLNLTPVDDLNGG